MIIFYKTLFEDFPLITILKSLIRILTVANENKLSMHYNIAKPFLNKITRMINLRYRDIAAMTTKASETELYQELRDHQINQDKSNF